MQINKISSTNFGTMPDTNTRKLLVAAKLSGIKTDTLENLMKDVYADKYIMTNTDNNGVTSIGLYTRDSKMYNSAVLFKNLLAYDEDNKSIHTIISALTEKFFKLADERSKRQIAIDQVENKFGKYV